MSRDSRIAVFDLDGTITRHDTYVKFLVFCLWSMPFRLLRVPLLVLYLVIHKTGFRSNHWLKAVFLRTVAGGISTQKLELLSENFYQKTMKENIKEGALAEISSLKKQGFKIVIATASFDFYVNKIANALQADEVLCTVAAVDSGGFLSGEIAGRNCLGQEKALRVEAMLSCNGWSHVSRAYSDDKVDLPLLKMASLAVVVDPKPATEAVAGELGYQIERWK